MGVGRELDSPYSRPTNTAPPPNPRRQTLPQTGTTPGFSHAQASDAAAAVPQVVSQAWAEPSENMDSSTGSRSLGDDVKPTQVAHWPQLNEELAVLVPPPTSTAQQTGALAQAFEQGSILGASATDGSESHDPARSDDFRPGESSGKAEGISVVSALRHVDLVKRSSVRFLRGRRGGDSSDPVFQAEAKAALEAAPGWAETREAQESDDTHRKVYSQTLRARLSILQRSTEAIRQVQEGELRWVAERARRALPGSLPSMVRPPARAWVVQDT